jgi:hypothetical protein
MREMSREICDEVASWISSTRTPSVTLNHFLKKKRKNSKTEQKRDDSKKKRGRGVRYIYISDTL